MSSTTNATGGKPGHCSSGGSNSVAAPEQTKRCTKCLAIKSVESFHKSKSKPDGLETRCKKCSRVRSLLRNHHGDRSGLSAEWVEKQLAKGCPVFGLPFSCADLGFSGLSPSVDQFIAQGGYTENNCWLISRKANAIKSNGTPEEIMQVAAWTQIVARFNRRLTQEQFVRLRERMNRTLLLAAESELDNMAEEVNGANS